jgi:shikimate kinase
MRPIVILGQMGSGKTSVGELVAKALDVPFYDSDRQIESKTGLTGSEIADTDGVDVLHLLEYDVLVDALDTGEPAVIAAAASVIDQPGIRPRLAVALCVHLTATAPVLDERRHTGHHRRHLEPGEDLSYRADLYRQAADITVDTTDLTAEGAADVVLEAVRKPV